MTHQTGAPTLVDLAEYTQLMFAFGWDAPYDKVMYAGGEDAVAAALKFLDDFTAWNSLLPSPRLPTRWGVELRRLSNGPPEKHVRFGASAIGLGHLSKLLSFKS